MPHSRNASNSSLTTRWLFVDARGRGIDDDEHFRGEVLAAAVENHARNLDVVAFAWALAQVELQRRHAMLAVDHEEL